MLQIFNSLSGQKEVFTPLLENNVRIYVCGMTVYDYCHLGHARVLIAFDIIVRYLRRKGYQVNYVRNITDVDDKIIARAAEQGETVEALTGRFIEAMHEDEKALAILPPDEEPRATAYIAEIVRMIETLCEKGFAYPAENGDVYYQVNQFADYGKLSKRKLDEQQEGARIEVDSHKKSPYDFVLWKKAKPEEVSWDSPWGKGRPGWHIECSAMSKECLGDTFDIHGGGPDLKFPHHENEIAQSEAASGRKFVNYWMHAGAVRVNKEKMSKSLGNFFTIREILESFPAEVVRYFIASSHYRSAIDYSADALVEASKSLERLYMSVRSEYAAMPEGNVLGHDLIKPFYQKFCACMDDDFNTAGAFSVLFELARAINIKKDEKSAAVLAKGMVEMAAVLGVLQAHPEQYLQGGESSNGLTKTEIDSQIQARLAARKRKDWAEADRIRSWLKENGVELNDSREGTTWQRL
jgi:cysteinyl-tRNA synthetase